MVKFTLNTPVMDQSKQSIFIYNYDCKSKESDCEMIWRVTACLCVCFVDRCLSLCTFSFVHCVVCSSSIYGFWLPLWYLQTLLLSLSKMIKPQIKVSGAKCFQCKIWWSVIFFKIKEEYVYNRICYYIGEGILFDYFSDDIFITLGFVLLDL
jgi:hypothetical protein